MSGSTLPRSTLPQRAELVALASAIDLAELRGAEATTKGDLRRRARNLSDVLREVPMHLASAASAFATVDAYYESLLRLPGGDDGDEL